MKKAIALMLALLMVFALFAGCGKKEEAKKDEGTSQPGSNTGNSGNANTPPKVDDTGKVQVGTETVDLNDENLKVFPSDDATFKMASQASVGYMTQAGNAFGASGTASLFFGESLLRWNSDDNVIEPFLAESYEWVDDTTMRLKLREDVTSIAGDPFTADDVVYTMNWGHETAALGSYYNIFDYENTKAVDKYTVDLALLNPYPFLDLDLCHSAYAMVVEKSVNDIGGKEATQFNPAAQTGPYKLVKHDTVSDVVYAERRDDYWGIMPYYKYVEVWVVPDANARAMGVEAGDFNFVMNPSSPSVAAADGKTAKGWYVPAAGRYVKFLLNSDKEPLNIKECRQAIGLGVNYDAILQVAGAGNGLLTDSVCFSPLNSLAYTEVGDPDNCFVGRYDPELAKQKLTEAGYPDGFKLVITYSGNDAIVTTSAELVKNHLGQIGIDVELDPQESAALSTKARAGDFMVYSVVSGNPNPKRSLNSLDGTRQDHKNVGGGCGANWAPEGIEEIIDRCIQTVDEEARMQAFAEFNDICREYVPQLALFCPYIQFLTSPDIVNLPVGTQGGPEVCRIFPAEYLGE